MKITIEVLNEDVLEKLLWLLKHFENEGIKIIYENNKSIDLAKLYGLGKGLWEEDAQEYINKLREER